MNPEYIPQSNEQKEIQPQVVVGVATQGVEKIIKCPECHSQNYRKIVLKSGKQRHVCQDCKRSYNLNSTFKHLQKSDDVWGASELGLQANPYRNKGEEKLNFSCIKQEWLKQNIKKFIRYNATITNSFNTLSGVLSCLKDFSKFLLQYLTVNQVEDINRFVIIDYLVYLNQRKLAPSTKSHYHYISALASFFETGIANKWFNVESYLIRKEDYPRRSKPLPRYIPDEVVR